MIHFKTPKLDPWGEGRERGKIEEDYERDTSRSRQLCKLVGLLSSGNVHSGGLRSGGLHSGGQLS